MSDIVVITESADDTFDADSIANVVTDGAMGLSTNIIRLHVLNELPIFKDCEAYHKCKDAGECTVADGLQKVLADLRKCDVAVFSMPLNGSDVTPSMKILLNRMTSFIDKYGKNTLTKTPKAILVISTHDGMDAAKNCSADHLHFINSLGFTTLAAIYYSDCNGKYKLADNRMIHESALSIGKALRNNYRSEKDRKAEILKIPKIDTEEFFIENFLE